MRRCKENAGQVVNVLLEKDMFREQKVGNCEGSCANSDLGDRVLGGISISDARDVWHSNSAVKGNNVRLSNLRIKDAQMTHST